MAVNMSTDLMVGTSIYTTSLGQCNKWNRYNTKQPWMDEKLALTKNYMLAYKSGAIADRGFYLSIFLTDSILLMGWDIRRFSGDWSCPPHPATRSRLLRIVHVVIPVSTASLSGMVNPANSISSAAGNRFFEVIIAQWPYGMTAK